VAGATRNDVPGAGDAGRGGAQHPLPDRKWAGEPDGGPAHEARSGTRDRRARFLPRGPETARHEILHPFDIVFVPKSTIATIQDFIDQYLDKPFLTPISRLAGFGFSYQLNGLVDLRNSSP